MKCLISGDIHLEDFRSYNVGDPKYRLKQFGYLGEWMASLGSDLSIICGDFYHTASPNPEVMQTGLDLLRTLGHPVYLTHGQHDLHSRDDHTRFESNTYLNVAQLLGNVMYCHRKFVTIGDKRFYFLGWEYDYHVEDGIYADVLIGHTDVTKAKVGSSEYEIKGGTRLDPTKFGIAFIGDIHRHQVLYDGKVVVPGTPLQNSFSDYRDVGVIIYDTKTSEWERVPTPRDLGGSRRLVFITTDEPERYSDDEFTITKNISSNVIPINHAPSKRKTLDPVSMLDSIISENVHLEETHKSVMKNVLKDANPQPDLRFKLHEVSIRNFATIHNFDLPLDDMGQVVLVVGENGTGKSNLLTAIKYVLVGLPQSKDWVSWGTPEMYVQASLTYQGHLYTVKRGVKKSGWITLEIDGEKVDKGTSTELSKFLHTELPFLDFLDIMIFDQSRSGFLSSYNYAARVSLTSRLLGLQILEGIHEAAMKFHGKLVSSMSATEQDINRTQSSIDSLNGLLEEEIPDSEGNLAERVSTLRHLKEQTDIVARQARDKVIRYEEQIKSYNQDMSRYKQEVESRRNQIKKLRENKCYACGQMVDRDKMEELINKTQSAADHYQELLDSLEIPCPKELEKFRKIIEAAEQKSSSTQAELYIVTGQLAKAEKMGEARGKIKSLTQVVANLQEDFKTQSKQVGLAEEYLDIVKPGGLLVTDVLNMISDRLTDDQFRVETCKELKSGETRPDFGVYFNLKGRWVKYDQLSEGQKTLTDLAILSRLIKMVGGAGLLVLDETLKYLDKNNTEVSVRIIQELMVENCIIVSHQTGFPHYDKLVHTKMQGNVSNFDM